MEKDHAPLGLIVSALGAAVLAISVFLPWYSVSITASGAASAQQQIVAIAQQYGNAATQAAANSIGSRFNSLVGHPMVTISAHRGLKDVSMILLALAAVALLASLFRLADMRGMFFATGRQITLLGVLASLVVFFRMMWRPGASQFILFSLSPGIWIALLSAVAVAAGGMIAGSAQAHHRARPKVGPGAPPLGYDVASPLARARPRR